MITTSKLGNLPHVHKTAHENTVSSSSMSSSDAILEGIDEELARLSGNDEKIVYLENAYSLHDKPLSSIHHEQDNILEGIKSRITDLDPQYLKTDIFNSGKRITDLDPQYFKTDISNSGKSFSLLGVELQPKQTSASRNNCLIHAVYQKNTNVPLRDELFTPPAIKQQLDIMTSRETTNTDRFSLQKATVVAIYGNEFGTAATLDELSGKLSEYLIQSQCFLDAQIAAGVMARALGRDILIISPAEQADTYTCKFINREGMPVGLASNDLSQRLNDPNTCLVWNKNGTHFELLKPVPPQTYVRRRL
jgi:hypothetical protein